VATRASPRRGEFVGPGRRPVPLTAVAAVEEREHYPVFDLVRIGAALLVIISHAFPLAGQPEPELIDFPVFAWSPGHIGVIIFFATSGFLVSQSWQRDPHLLRFPIRRVMRIWPGFIAVLLLAAYVIGPQATTLPRGDYLRNEGTWTYVWQNVTMHPIAYWLPEVFTGNPLRAVNGSIWSLPYEVLCYLGLLAIGMVRLVRSWFLGPLFLAAIVAYRYVVAVPTWHLPDDVWGIAGSFLVGTSVWFIGGAFLAQARSWVVRRHLVAAAVLLVFAVGAYRHAALLLVPSFCYLIIYVGTLPARWAGHVSRFGDPSYGMYLYAFPVAQVFVALHGGHVGPYRLMVESGIVSIVCGYASWHLVERHGVRLGRAIIGLTKRAGHREERGRAAPAPVPEAATSDA